MMEPRSRRSAGSLTPRTFHSIHRMLWTAGGQGCGEVAIEVDTGPRTVDDARPDGEDAALERLQRLGTNGGHDVDAASERWTHIHVVRAPVERRPTSPQFVHRSVPGADLRERGFSTLPTAPMTMT